VTQAEYSSQKTRGGVRGRFDGIHVWLAGRVGLNNAIALEIFAATFSVVFIVGFLILTTIQPKYTAMAIVGPQSSLQDDPTQGGMAGGFGGLGSLLGAAGIPENMLAFQALVGTAGFAEYAMKHDHLDKIFFPKGVHHSFLSNMLHAVLGQPVSNEVTVGDVQTALQSDILIQQRTQTQYLEVYYTNQNREDAIRVLNTVLYSADKMLRAREAMAMNNQVNYLSRAIASNTDVDRVDTFRKLMGQKLAAQVLIETQDTFAFKIFDAPFAPLVPNSPKIALLIILLILTALGLGATAAVGWLWRAGWRQN
jgi:uncharacterized protein involved in exopolysaccharide biosynthesis